MLEHYGHYCLYSEHRYENSRMMGEFHSHSDTFKDTVSMARTRFNTWKIEIIDYLDRLHNTHNGNGVVLAQCDLDIQGCLEAMRSQNQSQSIPQIIWKSYHEA